MRKTNKKGNVILGILSIILLVFAVSIATAYLIEPLSEMSDEITADPLMSAESKEIIQGVEAHYTGFWDGAIVFSLVLLWLFSIITAFFMDSHPVFFIITILLLIGVFIVAAILANEYETLTAEGVLFETQQYYPMTIWIMNHLVEISIVISCTYLVPIYVKLKG